MPGMSRLCKYCRSRPGHRTGNLCVWEVEAILSFETVVGFIVRLPVVI